MYGGVHYGTQSLKNVLSQNACLPPHERRGAYDGVRHAASTARENQWRYKMVKCLERIELIKSENPGRKRGRIERRR